MKNQLLLLILASNFMFSPLIGQNSHDEASKGKESLHHKNDIAGFVGATYIFETGFVLPTFGVEYVRKINSHIGLGVIAEIEVGSHIISMNEETHQEDEVSRESAFLMAPTVYFMVGDFIGSIGYGVELEKNENLGLLKISAMYALHLKNENWIVVPSVSYDYTSRFCGLVYGFCVARSF